MKSAHVLLQLTLIGTLILPAFPQQAYKAIDVKDGGRISGLVRLKGETPASLSFPITKDNDWCGTKKKSPRLVLGKDNGVANAVISLEGISKGKKVVAAGKYILDQRKCEYTPHVLLLPFGSPLEIVNSDAVLHNVHAYEGRGKTVFNIAQPIKGFRFPVKASRFATPGPYHATCDAGHPWMSAYVVVTEHPYYTLTDERGRFELTGVPPGTYKVKMWHEGVFVVRTQVEAGQPKAYDYEEPYEELSDVVVPPNGNVSLDFQLVLRTRDLTQN